MLRLHGVVIKRGGEAREVLQVDRVFSSLIFQKNIVGVTLIQ